MPGPTGPPQERALLVGVGLKGPARSTSDGRWPVEQSLAELGQLAHTAGMAVVGEVVQRVERPHVATYIGPGKAKEVVRGVAEAAADVVVFDDELSHATSANWRSCWGKRSSFSIGRR